MQFVYGLTDPLFIGPVLQSVRYVGKTDNPERRYKEHCRADDYSVKSTWIKDLKAVDLLPGLVIIETVKKHFLIDDRERYWIAYYLDQGAELVNANMSYNPVVMTPLVSFIDRENLGKRLMEVCARKVESGVTYNFSELARQVGIGQGRIHTIVHGKTLPSRNLLIKICKVLGCSLQEANEIFNLTDYRPPAPDELEDKQGPFVA